MLRSPLLLLLMLCLSSCYNKPADYEDSKGSFNNVNTVDLSSVFRIRCGSKVGTAFSLEGNKIITAAHVTSEEENCSIDQEQLSTKFLDRKSDYHIFNSLKLDSNEKSCKGFKEGELYFTVGWALGQRKVIEFYLATKAVLPTLHLGDVEYRDFRVLLGVSYPGMSGAPIFDLNGDVVGILNGYSNDHRFTFATPLSKTKLCVATPVGLEPTT